MVRVFEGFLQSIPESMKDITIDHCLWTIILDYGGHIIRINVFHRINRNSGKRWCQILEDMEKWPAIKPEIPWSDSKISPMMITIYQTQERFILNILFAKRFLGWFISELNIFKSKEILHRWFLEAVPVFETTFLWVHRSLLNIFGNVLDYLFSKIIFLKLLKNKFL